MYGRFSLRDRFSAATVLGADGLCSAQPFIAHALYSELRFRARARARACEWPAVSGLLRTRLQFDATHAALTSSHGILLGPRGIRSSLGKNSSIFGARYKDARPTVETCRASVAVETRHVPFLPLTSQNATFRSRAAVEGVLPASLELCCDADGRRCLNSF